MDLITLLNQDNVRISERADTPERANYACPLCGGYDRFVVWKNEGRYNAGRYWCNQCHISGDIISYLIDIRNLTYTEALEFLSGQTVTTASETPIKQKEFICLIIKAIDCVFSKIKICKMKIIETISEFEKEISKRKESGESVGFVPTMGLCMKVIYR